MVGSLSCCLVEVTLDRVVSASGVGGGEEALCPNWFGQIRQVRHPLARRDRDAGTRAALATEFAVTGAVGFTTVGRLGTSPGLLLVGAAGPVRDIAAAVRRDWLQVLVSTLVVYYVLLAGGTIGTRAALAALGGFAVFAAPWVAKRSPRWALVSLVGGALPFAIVTWWSLITPLVAVGLGLPCRDRPTPTPADSRARSSADGLREDRAGRAPAAGDRDATVERNAPARCAPPTCSPRSRPEYMKGRQTMRAAVNVRYGPPEVVGIQQVGKPSAGVGEVLVGVYAATVNRTDCAYRAASPFFMRFVAGLGRPKAMILGNEFAGVVEAVGPDVTAFRAGDRVFGYNEGHFGAHAEYLTVRADGPLAHVPAGVAFEQAAAATEGAHYALAFIRRIQVRDGTQILVNGATGAIGSAAVQLLKCLGAQVTAVCGPDGVDLVRGLGADRVIDYIAQDFRRDEHVYDAVFDAVGKSSFGRCRRLLTPGGVYSSTELGRFAQNPVLAMLSPLRRGRRVVFPYPSIDQAMVEHVRDLLASGRFQPLLDRRYPLERIVDAYRHAESGTKLGSVLIVVRPPE